MTHPSSAPRCAMLMTVYNGGRFLAPAVDSVLASDFGDFEFVIVDNVSTDGSRDYLRGIADPRIRLIENERNLGQTGALNVGLRTCTAPFVARLDADDLTEPDRIGRQVRALDDDDDLGLVGGQMTAIDADGRPLFRTRYPTESDGIRSRMVLQNCFDHSSVMFRRDAALAAGGYPADFAVCQDYALFSALMRAGRRLKNLAITAARVRVHPDQVMAQGGSEKEVDETIRVAAVNQAWAAGRPEDRALARTLHRLWSGARSAETAADDPDPLAAIARFLDENPGSGAQKALLAMLILGGPCDGRMDVRRDLLRRALKSSPPVALRAEFWKRLLRAALPKGQLGRLRTLASSR